MSAVLFPQYAVVLPAGGLGKRMGAALPKQMLHLGGKPLYRHSLDLFLGEKRIREIVLCVPRDWMDFFRAELEGIDRLHIVEGGAERWQSVRRGVEALSDSVEYVLVHDVARPLLSAEILGRVMEQVVRGPCIVAKPCSDTVKIVQNGRVEGTIDRARVWLAQTPQGCRRDLLLDLYSRMDRDAPWDPTDEASILEHYGIDVFVVQGDSQNDKVTVLRDLEIMEMRLKLNGVSS